MPALTWQDLLGHAAYGALAGATLAVLGQGGQVLRARYQRSLAALEADAIQKRRHATAADQAANLAELSYAREKAVEADKRGRAEMARLQRQQQEQRAAERQLQQQQQQQQHQQIGEDGTEMQDLGAASSPTSGNSSTGTTNGEIM